MPSNSTAVNGDPGDGAGSTGWTCAAILTLTVRCRASSCASITSTTHSGSPVCLSTCWTTRSPLDRSKSRTISIPPGRVCASGEHHPELDRDRTLKSHGPYLQSLTAMLTS